MPTKKSATSPANRGGFTSAATLGYLEIGHRADSLPAQVSGGEDQRGAIGRALANEPPPILADELTAAQDTKRGTKVVAMLRKIARERRSAVIALTHDHRLIEGFDTVYRLDDGRLAQVDHHAQAATPETVMVTAPTTSMN